MDDNRWWNEETVVLVTGANKGLGFEVCKQLGEKGLKVILTARDENRGHAAVQTLKEQGLHNIIFHQLDIQDEQSIATLVSWLSKELGGLDILINNAGVLGAIFDFEYIKKNDIPEDLIVETPKCYIIEYESAKACLDANYYGAKRVTKALLPLLRPSLGGARIVNVGSTAGQLQNLPSMKLQEELDDLNNLSEKYIDDLLDRYLDDVKSKNLEHKDDWPPVLPSYKMSKVALHAYTRILAKDLEKRPPNQRIFVNCVQPGFARTDLTHHYGDISAEEGAENLVRVALLPYKECPCGQFFDEKTLSHF